MFCYRDQKSGKSGELFRRSGVLAVLTVACLLSGPLAGWGQSAAVNVQQAPPTESKKEETKKGAKTAGQKTPAKVEDGEIPVAGPEDSEVKLGRSNAEENDKQVKLVTDAAIVERVNRIGQEIAAVANKTTIPAKWGSSQAKQFTYSFKVVDDKDVNAYSLPGGFIYVNKGLLDFARSDDELAGVLAHEVSHAAHHHMIKLIKEQNKIDRALLPIKLLGLALLVSNAGANANDVNTLMLSTQLYTVAKVNSYGVDAEKDADNMAIYLMRKTRYNPVGLYSFMTRLAMLERNRTGGIDMGIFRTHPAGEDRVEAAKTLLDELEIPLTLSAVDPTLQTTVAMVKGTKEGAELAEIKFRDIVLCRVAADSGQTADERARKLARRFDSLLDSRLQPFEIRTNKELTRVIVRGQAMLTLADAQTQNKTVADLARELSEAVMQINLRRQSVVSP